MRKEANEIWTREMKTQASTISLKRNRSERRVHSSTEVRLCKGIDCEEAFSSTRKDQVFCSRKCLLTYFDIARELGLLILKKRIISPKWKTLGDELLKELRGKV